MLGRGGILGTTWEHHVSTRAIRNMRRCHVVLGGSRHGQGCEWNQKTVPVHSQGTIGQGLPMETSQRMVQSLNWMLSKRRPVMEVL